MRVCKYFFGCAFLLLSASGCVEPSFDALASSFALRFGVEEVRAEDLGAFQPSLIIDVRTSAEQSVSILPGAVLVSPEQDLAALAGFASAERIIVYCAGGYRSARSIARIPPEKVAGKTIRNLHGGIVAYANAGLPLVTQVGTPTRKVHGYNEAWVKYVQAPAEGVTDPALE
jgi:rhodanese-related sulfurtransferase